jgi:hypothetical protein
MNCHPDVHESFLNFELISDQSDYLGSNEIFCTIIQAICNWLTVVGSNHCLVGKGMLTGNRWQIRQRMRQNRLLRFETISKVMPSYQWIASEASICYNSWHCTQCMHDTNRMWLSHFARTCSDLRFGYWTQGLSEVPRPESKDEWNEKTQYDNHHWYFRCGFTECGMSIM